jgi:hypothetical protein
MKVAVCRCLLLASVTVRWSTQGWPILQDTAEARTKQMINRYAIARNQPTPPPRVKINARGNVGRP